MIAQRYGDMDPESSEMTVIVTAILPVLLMQTTIFPVKLSDEAVGRTIQDRELMRRASNSQSVLSSRMGSRRASKILQFHEHESKSWASAWLRAKAFYSAPITKVFFPGDMSESQSFPSFTWTRLASDSCSCCSGANSVLLQILNPASYVTLSRFTDSLSPFEFLLFFWMGILMIDELRQFLSQGMLDWVCSWILP